MARTPQDRSRLAVIEQALTAMETEMREVFLMHRLDSLGYPEIAKRLGISVSQVERHIAGAMLRLSRALDAAERRD